MKEKKKEAKKKMLQELKKAMMEDMTGDLPSKLKEKKGLKKVTVMSDSPEGLKKGLSKADKILSAKGDAFADGGFKPEENEGYYKKKVAPYRMDPKNKKKK